jgi:hypothetical protein
VFLVVGHGRRQLLWFEVTRHPTAEWLARQITEAFPWTSAPAYLLRDNDCAYGHVFTSRVRAMGIRVRQILCAYAAYYNHARTHLALQKDAPCIERSNAQAPSSPCRFWLDCTTNTSGYDFQKGQGTEILIIVGPVRSSLRAMH